MITTYVTIGNSDDKLTQREWAAFLLRTHELLDQYATAMHGSWFSAPGAEWQNACWCVVLTEAHVSAVQDGLRLLAREFRQDSIAWAEAPTVEFLGAAL